MNDAQALGIVAIVQATWPWPILPDSSVQRWASLLADLDVNDARKAIDRLSRSEDRMPAVARIREEVRIVGMERSRGYQALPPGRPTPEEAARVATILQGYRDRRNVG